MKEESTLHPRYTFLAALALSLALGVVDWGSGYELQFFVFYFLPITLAGWYCGLARTLVVSALCGGLWFSIDLISGHPYSNWLYSCWSAVIRITSFLINGYSVVRIKELLKGKQQAMADIQQARNMVKTLEALLPICSRCKGSRNDEGYWQRIEEYLSHHPDALRSIGHCDKCAAQILHDTGFHTSSTAPDNHSGRHL